MKVVTNPAGENRLSQALKLAEDVGAGAVLVTSIPNVRYLSGFTGSNAMLLLSQDRRILLTDQRYGDQAELECPGWEIVVHGSDRERTLSDILLKFSHQHIAFEDQHVVAALFTVLTKTVDSGRWRPLRDRLNRLRSVKDVHEIDLIRQSAAIAEEGFNNSSGSIVPGSKESAIAAEIEYRMALAGSEASAFPTIVATGERSAFPHAHPGNDEVADDDLVTIDWGAVYRGYHSDLTRVVRVGNPSAEQDHLLSLTLSAFEAAIGAIGIGVTADSVDAAARSVFDAEGMERFSLRGLGHGVGLEIHEHPRIVLGSDEELQPGMVFTIEPGLYCPGTGGVRVEHTVLLTQHGPEILSRNLPLVIEDIQ